MPKPKTPKSKCRSPMPKSNAERLTWSVGRGQEQLRVAGRDLVQQSVRVVEELSQVPAPTYLPTYLPPTPFLPQSYLILTSIIPHSDLIIASLLPPSYLPPTSFLPPSCLILTSVLPPSYLILTSF
eukprot:640816-Rhodomonas_salina.1